MSIEVTVALIGAVSAIAGALAGGAAAVWGATRAARSTYLGPLHVARRTAQQSAYAKLLEAANEFEAGARRVRDEAHALVEDVGNESEGIPTTLRERDREQYRNTIRGVLDYGDVRAAGRLVALAGPGTMAMEALAVEYSARDLAGALRDVEERLDEQPGSFRPFMTHVGLRGAYLHLSKSLTKFAVTARESGGHGGDGAQ
ncbi:hypothetical protein P3L51_01465 [Streptomyces sp. PSRA5]|uniref:hypothetical protein n=1 Tax=Streptomyces panacea TaxID=3035064 RepID=UPI00339CB96C